MSLYSSGMIVSSWVELWSGVVVVITQSLFITRWTCVSTATRLWRYRTYNTTLAVLTPTPGSSIIPSRVSGNQYPYLSNTSALSLHTSLSAFSWPCLWLSLMVSSWVCHPECSEAESKGATCFHIMSHPSTGSGWQSSCLEWQFSQSTRSPSPREGRKREFLTPHSLLIFPLSATNISAVLHIFFCLAVRNPSVRIYSPRRKYHSSSTSAGFLIFLNNVSVTLLTCISVVCALIITAIKHWNGVSYCSSVSGKSRYISCIVSNICSTVHLSLIYRS